jgi:hypothetical protein
VEGEWRLMMRGWALRLLRKGECCYFVILLFWIGPDESCFLGVRQVFRSNPCILSSIRIQYGCDAKN